MIGQEKYTVTRNDGNPGHQNCDYFVVDLTHDKYAVIILIIYAIAALFRKPSVSKDIFRRLLK